MKAAAEIGIKTKERVDNTPSTPKAQENSFITSRIQNLRYLLEKINRRQGNETSPSNNTQSFVSEPPSRPEIGETDYEKQAKKRAISASTPSQSADAISDWDETMTTSRTLGKNLEQAGLNLEDLKGKTVLDLGSGSSQPFATRIKEMGIDAKVVSLDPKLTLKKFRLGKTYLNPGIAHTVIGASGTDLPFKNNSFDYVVAIQSLPRYFTDKKQIQPYLEEVGRVLKPGGEARIWPFAYMSGPHLDYSKDPSMYDQILDRVREKGYLVSTQNTEIEESGSTKKFTRLIIKKPETANVVEMPKAA